MNRCSALASAVASLSVRLGVVATSLSMMGACTTTLPRGAFDKPLSADIFISAEWRAFVDEVARSEPRAPENQLAQTCLTALAALPPELVLDKRYDACIDAAVRSLDATNFYVSVEEWKKERNAIAAAPNAPTVSAIRPGILLVTINTFASDAYETLAAGLRNLPGELRTQSVIVDLRNCPGGILDSVQEAASLFADGAVIGRTRGVNSGDIRAAVSSRRQRVISSELEADLRNAKLLLLVNEKTGSGAELFALGLRSSRSAVLLGTRTAGNAAVYTVRRLTRSDRALKIRTQTLLGPYGEKWEGVGLEVEVASPSSAVDAAASSDPWVLKAIQLSAPARKP